MRHHAVPPAAIHVVVFVAWFCLALHHNMSAASAVSVRKEPQLDAHGDQLFRMDVPTDLESGESPSTKSAMRPGVPGRHLLQSFNSSQDLLDLLSSLCQKPSPLPPFVLVW